MALPLKIFVNDRGRYVRCRCAVVLPILALLAGLTGCTTVGPDYMLPEFPLPDQWHRLSATAGGDAGTLQAAWWECLQDPVLSRLINEAVIGNLDVKEARSRVCEARERRANSRAQQFPTLDATGSARKSYSVDESGSGETASLYAAGFDAGWELDLFGGLRRTVEASQADLEAQIEDLNDVMVTLLAEVAVNYIDLRTYQTRLLVARRNVISQQETWELLVASDQAGSGDALAVAQAHYNLESSRAKIPDLEAGQDEAMNRLAVLVGKPAGALHERLAETRPMPEASVDLVVGVPADVVRQRPDIRQAERELAAQTARIGEAAADLYPKFSLSGSIGLESLHLGDLLSAGSRIGSIGPSFSWPIFDAGAIRSNVRVQEELTRQALIHYEATVLGALEEVENALTAYAKEQQKRAHLEAASAAARSASRLAEYQYTTGMIGFSDVLDAQRSLLSFEDQLAESQGILLSDLVRLYKALGGGWQSLRDQPPAANVPVDSETSIRG